MTAACMHAWRAMNPVKYMHTYTHALIHAYICVCTHTRACVHTCAHAYIYVFTHTYIRLRIHVYSFISVRASVQRAMSLLHRRFKAHPNTEQASAGPKHMVRTCIYQLINIYKCLNCVHACIIKQLSTRACMHICVRTLETWIVYLVPKPDQPFASMKPTFRDKTRDLGFE